MANWVISLFVLNKIRQEIQNSLGIVISEEFFFEFEFVYDCWSIHVHDNNEVDYDLNVFSTPTLHTFHLKARLLNIIEDGSNRFARQIAAGLIEVPAGTSLGEFITQTSRCYCYILIQRPNYFESEEEVHELFEYDDNNIFVRENDLIKAPVYEYIEDICFLHDHHVYLAHALQLKRIFYDEEAEDGNLVTRVAVCLDTAVPFDQEHLVLKRWNVEHIALVMTEVFGRSQYLDHYHGTWYSIYHAPIEPLRPYVEDLRAFITDSAEITNEGKNFTLDLLPPTQDGQLKLNDALLHPWFIETNVD